MNNGYAFVPRAPGAVPVPTSLVGTVEYLRVVIPLAGDFLSYVAVDDAGGQSVPASLGEIQRAFGADASEGSIVEFVESHMPTRVEPPESFVGFALLGVQPGRFEDVAREAAAAEKTIGLAGLNGGSELLVEFTGPDPLALEKSFQVLREVCGDAITRGAWGVGEVAAGSWRDR